VESLGMCGICGIIDFKGNKVRKESINLMTDAMVHRGPDDVGYYTSNHIGLGMRRLSIIDLEKGQQPISNEDNTIWVVLNGEIYNYVEIRRDLKKKGHILKTKSDTEVIVHLYEEKGIEAVNNLNGMFAFALYDTKDDFIWLVRDRLGIKPLYYAILKDKLIFASDLNSINSIINFDINPSMLLKYLSLAYIPTPDTIYKHINKLPPAHYLTIRKNKVDKNKYWGLPKRTSWNRSLIQAKEELIELINDSIRLRFRSDVPLGLFLSGGIDSSCILAFANNSGYVDLNTLTINFTGKNGQDSRYAKMLSFQYQTNHTEIEFGADVFIKELNNFINFLDEPVSDSASVPTYFLSKLARDNGIKVLLSGAGGDEIFGGYARYYSPKFGSPRWVAERFPQPIRNVTSNLWKIIQPQRGIRASSSAIAYGLECSGADILFLNQISKNKEFLFNVIEAIDQQYLELICSTEENYSNDRMALDLQTYLLDDILSLTDKATMAASVEGRVPLLDHRIVEFAFSLPSSINQMNSKPKGLFIECMKNILPIEILNRKKEGFNAPSSNWMLQSISFNMQKDLLDNLAPALREIFDIKLMEKLFFNKKEIKTAGHTIFGLFMLNRWLQIHHRKTA